MGGRDSRPRRLLCARDFQRVAHARGFSRRRQSGSHERWIHADGRSVTIPLHGGREIGPPLFFKILRQLKVSPIYLWFGVPVDRIPYTTGAGDAKVIDVDTL